MICHPLFFWKLKSTVKLVRQIGNAFFLVALVSTACSGGGGAKVELVPVATELRPTPHGYSFANFAASASPE